MELSDLQAALTGAGDREVFSRLVFPRARGSRRLEVVTFGDSEHKQVTVRTHFADAQGERYDLREPVEPEEIGQLYRLFFQERFPKTVSEMDRYLIVADAADRVVGGLCYRMESPEMAHLDGVVVNASVTGRGIATALLEDFATRMASRGVQGAADRLHHARLLRAARLPPGPALGRPRAPAGGRRPGDADDAGPRRPSPEPARGRGEAHPDGLIMRMPREHGKSGFPFSGRTRKRRDDSGEGRP